MAKILNNKKIWGGVQNELYITSIDMILQEAVNEQLDLGHTALVEGIISNNWRKTQEWWIQQNVTKSTIDQCRCHVVDQIQQYTYNIWQKRNEILHGETKRECIEKNKIRLVYLSKNFTLSIEVHWIEQTWKCSNSHAIKE